MRSKEEYMELLRSYFLNKAKAYGVVKMALFGSVVRGEQTETSDVDVAYEGKADILLRCRMKQELEDLFGCRVDIIRLREQLSGTAFLQNIFDKVRIETLLNRVENAILLIQSKAGQLETPNDFLLDKEGTFLLSGICMQLIFIGESIKTIDNKTSHAYLTNYPNICWTQIMGLRDIIVHEYHRIDEEEIFNIIKVDLSPLLLTIRQMKKELPNY